MSSSLGKIVPPVEELDLFGVLVRTDYTDDARFQEVLAAARQQGADDGYAAGLLVVENPRLAGIAPRQVPELVEVEGFAFIADARSMTDGTLEVVDLYEESETYLTTFRVSPGAVSTVEANLMIANLDFTEFADDADADGVYRN